jgi:hypothetical protein
MRLGLVSGCLLETQSITLVPRWRRHPRGTMEVSQPWQRLLESVLCHQPKKNIDRYMLLLKNVTENLKNLILYV